MLLEAIKEAKARERKKGERALAEKIVLNMHKKGLKPEQIAEFTGISLNQVKKFLPGK